MSESPKTETYWENKVDKYTSENSRKSSGTDATVITALRRNLKHMVAGETPDDTATHYIEKRRKLLNAQKILVSPVSNKSRILASLVPDEVIYNPDDYNSRHYLAALMFADVSGFTELCERYSTKVEDGISTMTQILNSYIGAMVQEIVMHGGDLLKFSGDAFLAMWKTSPKLSIMQAVQTAIDCGLIIQRDYGTLQTDIGIVLKVKVAISAGNATFSIIGDADNSHWVTVGQPVWDVKNAELISKAGDVIAARSAWNYMNASRYVVKHMLDNMHFKIVGLSATWRNVVLHTVVSEAEDEPCETKLNSNKSLPTMSNRDFFAQSIDTIMQMYTDTTLKSYRPSVSYAMQNTQLELSKFIPRQVLKTVDADEPLESLTEMRYVIIVFLNIIPHIREDKVLISIVKETYNIVVKTLPEYQGVLDKLSMFDKDLVCLAVFGIRGFKHELNVQQALSCSVALKSQLDIINHVDHVSIGVTAGFIYCGVVGHVMRREMSVIGMCVNKGARLMVAYPDRITCDKEVFLQSQLPSSHFTLLPHKDLKGFTNVGPVYEYLDKVVSDTAIITTLIGRENELKTFDNWLQNIIKDHKKHRYNKNFLIIEGQLRVGKTRFVEEIMKLIPTEYPMTKMIVEKANAKDYKIIQRVIWSGIQHILPEFLDLESKVAALLNNIVQRKLWYLLNPILGTKFPGLSEKDINQTNNAGLDKLTVEVFIKLCSKIFQNLHFFVFDRAGEIDIPSLTLMSVMLDKLPIVAIMAIHTQTLLKNEVLMADAKKPRTLVIHMEGVDRWHHATIVCQLMKVDAISSELEKVVQLCSEGYVSWIEKFIRIMIHSKQLQIVELTKKEVLSMGAIISLEEDTKSNKGKISSRNSFNDSKEWLGGWEVFRSSYRATDAESRRSNIVEKMRVAILNPSYKFDDMQIEATSYVIFLKTYDNMAGFEKLVLKCSSAMGEIFHTTLLIQVLRAEKEDTIIRGILKLFDLGIFEFTDKEYLNLKTEVNIHKSDTTVTTQDRERVSVYLRSAYIRFRDPMFFKYAYDLLTENQKKHYHNKAISVLRSSINKCDTCGGGAFNMILGVRRRDIFNEKQEVRERMSEYFKNGGFQFKYFNKGRPSKVSEATKRTTVSADNEPVNMSISESAIVNLKHLTKCECESLLSSMYLQIIRHCKKSEKVQSLIEAYMEFTDLKIHYSDVNEAIVIINEADEFVKSPKFKLPDNNPRMLSWQRNFIEGRISSKKGKIMYEFGNLPEAKRYLYEAMALFEYPFPKNTELFQLKFILEKRKQKELLRSKPEMYLGKPTGVVEIIHNHVSETLYYLYDYFMTVGKYKEAHLAAIWSFNTILKSNTDFNLICAASANMISLGRQLVQWDLCSQIEELSMTMCLKRVHNLDITDVNSYIQLITSVLLFRLTKSDTDTCIRIGQKLITIFSFTKANYNLIFAMATLGEMLTAKKMFRALLAFYTEFKSVQHMQDFICKTFYYAGVMDIYLDTGYWIENYSACYSFYLDNKDEIYSNKHVDPGWYLIIGLGLYAMRSKQWDLIAEWKETYSKFMSGYHLMCKYPMTLMRFLETQLLYLVYQIKEKSASRYQKIRHTITIVFDTLDRNVQHNKSYKAGVYMLKGYYSHINGDNSEMHQYMDKGLELSKELEFPLLVDLYTFLTKILDENHREGKIYEWIGKSYKAEITAIKAKLRANETFSNIISDL